MNYSRTSNIQHPIIPFYYHPKVPHSLHPGLMTNYVYESLNPNGAFIHRNLLSFDISYKIEGYSYSKSALSGNVCVYGWCHSKDAGVLHEAGGTADHLHMLLTIDRSISIADAVRAIKARSSLWLTKQGVADFGWQNGYAVFSVRSSVAPKVRKYIQNQESHHQTQSTVDELVAFCDRHGIPLVARE